MRKKHQPSVMIQLRKSEIKHVCPDRFVEDSGSIPAFVNNPQRNNKSFCSNTTTRRGKHFSINQSRHLPAFLNTMTLKSTEMNFLIPSVLLQSRKEAVLIHLSIDLQDSKSGNELCAYDNSLDIGPTINHKRINSFANFLDSPLLTGYNKYECFIS